MDGLWEEISEAPTQGIGCAAVRRTVEPVERARTIRRTAAKNRKRLNSPSAARSEGLTLAPPGRGWGTMASVTRCSGAPMLWCSRVQRGLAGGGKALRGSGRRGRRRLPRYVPSRAESPQAGQEFLSSGGRTGQCGRVSPRTKGAFVKAVRSGRSTTCAFIWVSHYPVQIIEENGQGTNPVTWRDG